MMKDNIFFGIFGKTSTSFMSKYNAQDQGFGFKIEWQLHASWSISSLINEITIDFGHFFYCDW